MRRPVPKNQTCAGRATARSAVGPGFEFQMCLFILRPLLVLLLAQCGGAPRPGSPMLWSDKRLGPKSEDLTRLKFQPRLSRPPRLLGIWRSWKRRKKLCIPMLTFDSSCHNDAMDMPKNTLHCSRHSIHINYSLCYTKTSAQSVCCLVLFLHEY